MAHLDVRRQVRQQLLLVPKPLALVDLVVCDRIDTQLRQRTRRICIELSPPRLCVYTESEPSWRRCSQKSLIRSRIFSGILRFSMNSRSSLIFVMNFCLETFWIAIAEVIVPDWPQPRGEWRHHIGGQSMFAAWW